MTSNARGTKRNTRTTKTTTPTAKQEDTRPKRGPPRAELSSAKTGDGKEEAKSHSTTFTRNLENPCKENEKPMETGELDEPPARKRQKTVANSVFDDSDGDEGEEPANKRAGATNTAGKKGSPAKKGTLAKSHSKSANSMDDSDDDDDKEGEEPAKKRAGKKGSPSKKGTVAKSHSKTANSMDDSDDDDGDEGEEPAKKRAGAKNTAGKKGSPAKKGTVAKSHSKSANSMDDSDDDDDKEGEEPAKKRAGKKGSPSKKGTVAKSHSKTANSMDDSDDDDKEGEEPAKKRAGAKNKAGKKGSPAKKGTPSKTSKWRVDSDSDGDSDDEIDRDDKDENYEGEADQVDHADDGPDDDDNGLSWDDLLAMGPSKCMEKIQHPQRKKIKSKKKLGNFLSPFCDNHLFLILLSLAIDHYALVCNCPFCKSRGMRKAKWTFYSIEQFKNHVSLDRLGWISTTDPLPNNSTAAQRRREHLRSHLKDEAGLHQGMKGFPPCAAIPNPPSKGIQPIAMDDWTIHSTLVTKQLDFVKYLDAEAAKQTDPKRREYLKDMIDAHFLEMKRSTDAYFARVQQKG